MNQRTLKCKINSDEGDAALLVVTFPSLWTACEGIWNSSVKSLSLLLSSLTSKPAWVLFMTFPYNITKKNRSN